MPVAAKRAARLRALKGRFVLGIDDTPEIRALYASRRIDTAELNYTLPAHRAVRQYELTIEG